MLRRLVFLAAASTTAAQLNRILFDNVTASLYGAYCLDGSPGGYYIDQGDPRNFVIFLEGGGACYLNTGSDDTNCYVREKSGLGSSTYWPSTYTDTGNVLSSDPRVNPDFANFTHVYLPYCSGDVHTGTRSAQVNGEYPFIFAGHNLFRAVIDRLLNTTFLASADAVLLSGSSAGGIGTFSNADYLAARIPAVPRYRASPQGGWFFPQTVNYTAWTAGDLSPPYAGENMAIDGLWLPYLQPACVAQHNESYCGSVGNFYPYVTTPLFVIENQADSNQVFVQEQCPLVNNATVGAYVQYYIEQMRASVSQIETLNISKAGGTVVDGLFFPNCIAHTENTAVNSATSIGGYTYVQMLGSWFFDRNNGIPTRLTDYCNGVDCSAGCPPLPTDDGEALQRLAAHMPRLPTV